MTVSSMTGFGRGEASSRLYRACVELSSVNRKQLEVRINLPRTLAALESRAAKEIAGAISRGSVSGSVALEWIRDRSCRVAVDHEAAASIVRAMRLAAAKLRLKDDLSARALLQMPDVLRLGAPDPDADEAWPVVQSALQKALRQLALMRAREGEALQRDLSKRMGRLAALLANIGKLAPRVAGRHRLSLLAKLKRGGLPTSPDDPQFAREILLFVDRSDISEEITRLRSHLGQAGKLLRSGKPAGRTLDFIAQEMFREINTIGSKANDAGISRQVVMFKTELERIREQVQNVE